MGSGNRKEHKTSSTAGIEIFAIRFGRKEESQNEYEYHNPLPV